MTAAETMTAAEARAERDARMEAAAAKVARIDQAIAADKARRAKGSGTFRSVSAALTWWGAAKHRMRGAHAMHPRTEHGPDGQQHRVSVDGGRGGDIDEVLATIATIDMLIDRVPQMARRQRQRAIDADNERRRLAGLRPRWPGGRPSRISMDDLPHLVRAHWHGIDGQIPHGVTRTIRVAGCARPNGPTETIPDDRRRGSPWEVASLAAHYGCSDSCVRDHIGRAVKALHELMVDGGVVV